MVLDIIISSLINGSVYALLAIGFSLVFGVARIVNIAHTAFYMVGAFLIYTATNRLGLPPLAGMALSIVVITLLGLLCYKLFIESIREHESAVLIGTIALAMIFQEVMLLIFGAEFQSVPSLIDGYINFFNVKVTNQQILTLGSVFIVLIAIWFLLMKTRLGLAIRATAQDREAANLMGMNEARVAMVTMGISVGLAAFAGSIVIPLTILHPHMWMQPLIMMLSVVVLGGLGSLKGSFLGAYILATAESLVVFLLPMGAFLKGSVALSVMILVLLIRPEGLFGVSFEEER